MTACPADAPLSPHRDGSPADRTAWAKLCNLQRRILPAAAPPVAGYRVEMAYRPAFVVTGDYHDFFPRTGGLAVFVGDGTGHGPAAAMLMAIMRTILHTRPELHGTPGDTLDRAGRVFGSLIPSDLFMTGIYMVLDGDGGVSWATAGHRPPIIVRAGGRVEPGDLSANGNVLGIDAGGRHATVTARLSPGDRLFVFTDGLYEPRDRTGVAFGWRRLGDRFAELAARPLAEVAEAVVAAVVAHAGRDDLDDDFTIVAVERL